MLAPAIADLDDEALRLRKEGPGVERAIQDDLDLGQHFGHLRLLPAMQRLARAAPEKGAGFTGAGFWKLVVGQGWALADFDDGCLAAHRRYNVRQGQVHPLQQILAMQVGQPHMNKSEVE